VFWIKIHVYSNKLFVIMAENPYASAREMMKIASKSKNALIQTLVDRMRNINGKKVSLKTRNLVKSLQKGRTLKSEKDLQAYKQFLETIETLQHKAVAMNKLIMEEKQLRIT
jgi:hypothetical protein